MLATQPKSTRHGRRLAKIASLPAPIPQAVEDGRLSLRAAERLAAMSRLAIETAAELIQAGQDAAQVVAEICPQEWPPPRMHKSAAEQLREDLLMLTRVLVGDRYHRLLRHAEFSRHTVWLEELRSAHFAAERIYARIHGCARDLRVLWPVELPSEDSDEST